jgi:hypothetical protein
VRHRISSIRAVNDRRVRIGQVLLQRRRDCFSVLLVVIPYDSELRCVLEPGSASRSAIARPLRSSWLPRPLAWLDPLPNFARNPGWNAERGRNHGTTPGSRASSD